jgi:hypothetical protein
LLRQSSINENSELKLVAAAQPRRNLSTIRNKSRINLLPTRLPNLEKAMLG